jgi:hypothetical protein
MLNDEAGLGRGRIHRRDGRRPVVALRGNWLDPVLPRSIEDVWEMASIPLIGSKHHFAPLDDLVIRAIGSISDRDLAVERLRHEVEVIICLAQALQFAHEQISPGFIDRDIEFAVLTSTDRYPWSHGVSSAVRAQFRYNS